MMSHNHEKVVYLYPSESNTDTNAYSDVASQAGQGIKRKIIHGVKLSVALTLYALLTLIKPFVALLLLMAFIMFAVTVISGFIIGTPDFPKWEMLALSVGAFLVCGVPDLIINKMRGK